MSSPATVEQVRALADELVRSGARAGKAVAVSATPTWSGPDRFASKTGVPIQVAVASTVLAFHDALAVHTTSVVEDPTLLLVLTVIAVWVRSARKRRWPISSRPQG